MATPTLADIHALIGGIASLADTIQTIDLTNPESINGAISRVVVVGSALATVGRDTPDLNFPANIVRFIVGFGAAYNSYQLDVAALMNAVTQCNFRDSASNLAEAI